MKLVESILTKNPCYTAGRTITVKGLMLHSVGCPQPSALAFIKNWNSPSYDRACVHGFIDGNDGTVYQTLPWNYRGWHCGSSINGSANNTHIGVEMCEPACMRISEFCGLTLKDIDLKNKTVNIDHQLQRTSKREYVIEPTKTNAGTRVIPITDEVAEMFRSIIEDRPKYKVEKVVAGYSGFLFLDKDGMPLVAMHWEHRFNSMVGRYNEIYKVQIPNITPHVCRHTYCSNQAKAGMNPKTLQYLMGHSDIAVTLNVYTHVGLEDAENELRKMQTLEGARKEMGLSDKDDKPLKQTMFKVV